MNQYCVYLLAKNSEKEHVALAKKASCNLITHIRPQLAIRVIPSKTILL